MGLKGDYGLLGWRWLSELPVKTQVRLLHSCLVHVLIESRHRFCDRSLLKYIEMKHIGISSSVTSKTG